MTKSNSSIIVCAALRKDDILIAGPRHFDSVMRSQIKAIAKDNTGAFATAEQGFLDQYGTFWNRTDAMVLVRASGQKIDYERNGSKTELFSEGLY